MSRSGNYLVISRSTLNLPNFCITCAEPGVKTVRKTYQWHHPLFFLLVFPIPILYAIIAAPFSKKMSLGISLCKRHAGRRLALQIVGTILLLGSIPLGVFVGGGAGLAIGVFGFLGAIVLLIVGANTIRPVKMTDSEATYTGLGESFLQRFSGKGSPN